MEISSNFSTHRPISLFSREKLSDLHRPLPNWTWINLETLWSFNIAIGNYLQKQMFANHRYQHSWQCLIGNYLYTFCNLLICCNLSILLEGTDDKNIILQAINLLYLSGYWIPISLYREIATTIFSCSDQKQLFAMRTYLRQLSNTSIYDARNHDSG